MIGVLIQPADEDERDQQLQQQQSQSPDRRQDQDHNNTSDESFIATEITVSDDPADVSSSDENTEYDSFLTKGKSNGHYHNHHQPVTQQLRRRRRQDSRGKEMQQNKQNICFMSRKRQQKNAPAGC